MVKYVNVKGRGLLLPQLLKSLGKNEIVVENENRSRLPGKSAMVSVAQPAPVLRGPEHFELLSNVF